MSQQDVQKFAALLTEALYQIKRRQAKPIAVIQDEIGYAMGRKGGSVIESWRKGGHMPQRKQDVERLAVILVERGALSRTWLEAYLQANGYGAERVAFCDQLLPTPGAGPAADWGPPFQAPALIPHFIGRSRQQEAVCARLTQAAGPRIVALVGMGGVGKTTLAAQIAHSLRAMFADGVLWAYVAANDPLKIGEQWAKGYGYDLSSLHDLQNRAAALRGLLARKQALLVLDDVTAANDLRPLLPGGDRCAVLLTTRNEEAAVALSADILRLDELSMADSLALLATILGDERLRSEQEAARQICRQLHHLPLALEIAGQLLKTRPNRRLADMATHLEALDHRLNLRISDRAVRTSFSASWTALDEPHRIIFACLGVFAGRAFGVEALAYVAGVDLYTAQDRLYTLKALSLIGETGADRFQQHPLLADFAGEQLGAAPAHYGRMAQYYERFAAEHGEHDALLAREGENIMAAMRTASDLQKWPLVLALGRSLTAYWLRQALYREARQGYRLMQAAASALDDEQSLAFALNKWGWACLEQDDYAEAAQHLAGSLRLFERQGDDQGRAEVHYALARMALERTQYAAAQQQIAAYHQLCERRQDSIGVARACYQQAFLAYHQGDWPRAHELCRQAYAFQIDQADNPDILATLRLLADVAIEQQEYAAAEEHCRQALAIAQRLQNRAEIAAIYYSMTVVARRQKQFDLAMDYTSTALELFEKIGDQGFLALVLYEQSRIYDLLGEPYAAQEIAERSAAIFQSLEDSFALVYVLNHLGRLQMAAGRAAAARSAWLQGVAVAEPLTHPLLDQLRQRLAQLDALPAQS